MLRITKAEEQALRLAMRLATVGKQQTLSELAAQELLPEPTVAKLLGHLRRGGVVAAVRGRNGGYELSASPALIPVAAVVAAVRTADVPLHLCAINVAADDCPRSSDCGLRSVWRHLQVQVEHLLEQTSLADLMGAESAVAGHLDRLWPREAQGIGPQVPVSVSTPTASDQGVEDK